MFALPIESPIPRDAIDFCDGPEALGSTQVQQYVSRWACWIATAGIRIGKYPDGSVLSDSFGIADDLFDPGTKPSKLSFCFEQDALPVIAIQDGTDIEVRRKVSGIVNTYIFAGLSPCMIYNGLVVADTGSVDAFCLYLKAPGTKLFARVQRDNFGIEYELNGAFADGLTLRALRKADRLWLNGSNYLMLRATATDGREVYFRTRAFPPFPQYATDRLSLDSTVESGEIFDTVMIAPLVADTITIDATAESGDYVSSILPPQNAPGDELTLDSTSESGTYTLSVLSTASPGSAITLDVAVESGTYVQTVISTTNPSDSATLDVSVESGIYTT